jgi:hypothetical protein
MTDDITDEFDRDPAIRTGKPKRVQHGLKVGPKNMTEARLRLKQSRWRRELTEHRKRNKTK